VSGPPGIIPEILFGSGFAGLGLAESKACTRQPFSGSVRTHNPVFLLRDSDATTITVHRISARYMGARTGRRSHLRSESSLDTCRTVVTYLLIENAMIELKKYSNGDRTAPLKATCIGRFVKKIG
jgi:hypothetical protein